MSKEKVYVTRDEDDTRIWVWRKPKKGNFAPQQLKDCDTINWQREDIEKGNCYLAIEFKKKFGFTIRMKTKRCLHLEEHLLNNDKYKLFTDVKGKK